MATVTTDKKNNTTTVELTVEEVLIMRLAPNVANTFASEIARAVAEKLQLKPIATITSARGSTVIVDLGMGTDKMRAAEILMERQGKR
jgi:hypothetical protein